MRALILNGALGPDPLLDELVARLTADFVARRYAVESMLLREVPVAYCQGCFECWTHTPGTCKIEDAGRDISRGFATADVVVIVTPVLFGSYSSEVKKAIDRTIGTLLPFFRRLDGEVHHVPRYRYPPALSVLGVFEAPDPVMERTLRVLTLRNAINFGAPFHAVGAVQRGDTAARRFGECDALVSTLTAIPARAPVDVVEDVDTLLPPMPVAADDAPPRRAVVLVGSAKPVGTSTSESLARVLADGLVARNVTADVHFAHREAHEPERLAALVQAIRAADLLVIASPIYIDALPSLVTRVLEAVVADRDADDTPPPLTVTMLLNCGFPESRHASVAATLGALFARRARARWAGALQVGAGAVIHGRPLSEVGHSVKHLPPLLDAAAAALASGRAISAETRAAFRTPLLSTSLYLAAGDAGWLWTASHEGALTRLWERPAEALATP